MLVATDLFRLSLTAAWGADTVLYVDDSGSMQAWPPLSLAAHWECSTDTVALWTMRPTVQRQSDLHAPCTV